MKKLLLVLIFTMVLFSVIAQTPVIIKKGEPAPFDGVLYTMEDSKALEQARIDLQIALHQIDMLLLKIDMLEYTNQEYAKQIELWESKYKLLNEEYVSVQEYADKLKRQNVILGWVGGISISIAVGEMCAAITAGLLYYYLK